MDVYPNQDNEVTITEAGTISVESDTDAVSADGSLNSTLTVPTGKSWKIKALFWEKQSGTYAINTAVMSIVPNGGADFQIYRKDSATTREILLLNNDIVLNAGDYIKFTNVISSYSVTGNIIVKALVLVSDA